jgi:AmiR/NasT family two-component response regulator
MRGEGVDEAAAFRRLREIAMESRRTIEDAAEAVVARSGSENDARDSA